MSPLFQRQINYLFQFNEINISLYQKSVHVKFVFRYALLSFWASSVNDFFYRVYSFILTGTTSLVVSAWNIRGYHMVHMESYECEPLGLGRYVVQAPYELNLTDQRGTSKKSCRKL